jgi:hypothetical protein
MHVGLYPFQFALLFTQLGFKACLLQEGQVLHKDFTIQMIDLVLNAYGQ